MVGKVLAALGVAAAISWVTRELGAGAFGGLVAGAGPLGAQWLRGWLASSVIRFHEREGFPAMRMPIATRSG